MRFEFGALPWGMLGRRLVMVTLTYPGEWDLWVPDARTLVRHREALKERWRRRYGAPVGVWVVEFQRRGAPHLHMYLALPDEVSGEEYRGLQRRTMRRRALERSVGAYEARRQTRAPSGEFATWLRTAWWEVVDSRLRAHHGRGVDLAVAFYSDRAERETDRVRVAEYLWRESGKWAQKQPPEGFGSLKFYGRWGGKQGFKPVVTSEQLNDRAAIEIRRVMRRMREGKMREAAERSGRRYRPANRSRGRDGLTVFGVDGEVWGPRLTEWAEGVAMAKALNPAPRRNQSKMSDHSLLLQFPDLGLDSEPWPDDEWHAAIPPDEYYEQLAEDRQREDLQREAALIEAIEKEAADEAAAEEAWILEQVRDRRRAELRRSGGWAGPQRKRIRGGGRRRP